MRSISRGIKAGLAAGLVYAVLIGLLHTSFLEICSPFQIAHIQQVIATMNSTTIVTNGTNVFTTTSIIPSAQDIFSTDLVIFSLDWAVGALAAGIIYGAIFGLIYERLPGSSSKRKGIYLSVFVFIVGIVLGLSGWELGCSPDYYHLIPVLASAPISVVYGYLLGILFDSFGSLEREERETAKKKEKEKEAQRK